MSFFLLMAEKNGFFLYLFIKKTKNSSKKAEKDLQFENDGIIIWAI